VDVLVNNAAIGSKGAVRLMTKSAAIRYAKEGIRVNSVHPGFIDTPMLAADKGTPSSRRWWMAHPWAGWARRRDRQRDRLPGQRCRQLHDRLGGLRRRRLDRPVGAGTQFEADSPITG
jgi:NAD(P)-dependent dehydrogenase (short-subunit alcohol dehydrogenase family)